MKKTFCIGNEIKSKYYGLKKFRVALIFAFSFFFFVRKKCTYYYDDLIKKKMLCQKNACNNHRRDRRLVSFEIPEYRTPTFYTEVSFKNIKNSNVISNGNYERSVKGRRICNTRLGYDDRVQV